MSGQTKGEVYLQGENYGLRAGVLGPLETLAQSVSAMAPSTSASPTIPLVFALAGNATWFVYLLATGATLLVGFCVSRFARLSASPGSLYSYASDTLPPVFGVVAAWGLLLAYIATGASVAGGALYYAVVLSQQLFHWTPPALPTLIVVCLAAAFVAYRDVKLSAELMLWIEVVSVSLILIVPAVMLFRFGFQFDVDQFQLKGVSMAALGPALVLAMILIVIFDLRSATDENHARIPWIYLGYIAAGVAWYALRRKTVTTDHGPLFTDHCLLRCPRSTLRGGRRCNPPSARGTPDCRGR